MLGAVVSRALVMPRVMRVTAAACSGVLIVVSGMAILHSLVAGGRVMSLLRLPANSWCGGRYTMVGCRAERPDLIGVAGPCSRTGSRARERPTCLRCLPTAYSSLAAQKEQHAGAKAQLGARLNGADSPRALAIPKVMRVTAAAWSGVLTVFSGMATLHFLAACGHPDVIVMTACELVACMTLHDGRARIRGINSIWSRARVSAAGSLVRAA